MMKSKLYLVVYLSVIMLFNSCLNNKCLCEVDSKTLIQKEEIENKIITLSKLEQGAYGVIVILRVCDKENNLIEEINLRGDDVVPKIVSINKNNIFINCVYFNSPNDGVKVDIPFENIVLGDGLINKNNLKFNYFFKGEYPN